MAVDFNLSFLKELEREKVLEVLYRDQSLQKAEEERIRKLRTHLQQFRWKGAKSVSRKYQERSCARCQKALGSILNRGFVCDGCSHRVCQECQVFLRSLIWKCTVCYLHREIKIKTGDWFFEERENKFPSAGKHETAGAKFLKSYQNMSKISVVPPTPPAYSDDHSENDSVEFNKAKGFNKSMENVFFCLTTQMKKFSKSQNDMTTHKYYLTTDYSQKLETRKERRSHSDTAINIASQLEKAHSLHDLIYKAKEEGLLENKITKQMTADNLRLKQSIPLGNTKTASMPSIHSMCTEADIFENANVTGGIEFAIIYNYKTCTLEINIKACKNLAYGEEKKKKCNPYVKIYLLPDKSAHGKTKTSVKKNTVDPLFNETLKYTIAHTQLETRTLQVSLWHSSTLKRKVFLGEVTVPFELWDFEDSTTQSFKWYHLRAKPNRHEESVVQYHGELFVQVRLDIPSLYNRFLYGELVSPGTDVKKTDMIQLYLRVNGAKNLSLRPDGILNPYVKSCLVFPNKREIKQMTPVLKKQGCPEWKHTIIFNIQTPNELQNSRLDLTVWDQSPVGGNDRFLGGASMNAGEETNLPTCPQPAQLLWQKLLNKPNEWIEGTLELHSSMVSLNY
ncbi:synaptotagmin-like protein 3 [Spea bombifrons]|uniref:synaptotagmin-like protein 3 n=1 Tax=Spea bombifrons TaxID=233779 RepID=UPI00234968F7|nr:synaptotagmin-like protein 3 [Spea bombifrons]XP_053316847.1 synaptotagmin-like protein 3 [Spea bombifrons]XP_053316848.1 synaptotagmin-like protein 3 [Spea bombifrons]